MEKINELCVGMKVENREKNEISIPLEEYARLKDIETRFTVLKNQMLHAEYCPIHTQIILGIENTKKKELNLDFVFNADDGK